MQHVNVRWKECKTRPSSRCVSSQAVNGKVKHVHTTTDTVCLASGLSTASGSLMRQPLNLGASWYRASVEEVVEAKAQSDTLCHEINWAGSSSAFNIWSPTVFLCCQQKSGHSWDGRTARVRSLQHDQCVVRLTGRNPSSVPEGSLRTHSGRTCKCSLARQRVDWVDSALPCVPSLG